MTDKVDLETVGVPVEGKMFGLDEKNIVAAARKKGAKKYVLEALAEALNACLENRTTTTVTFITFAAFIVRMSLDDEVQHYFRRLINDARPIDDEDWGSDRQIAAETRLWAALKSCGIDIEPFKSDDEESNTYELLDKAMTLLNADVRLELPAEERWIGLD